MILVADDDRVFNHYLCRSLKQAGFTVTSAFDALQASTMILRGQFDAVVLDIQMPAGTGLEVLKRIRQSPRCMDTVVIAISGLAGSDIKEQARALGAAEYLAKPFEVSQLVGVLRDRVS